MKYKLSRISLGSVFKVTFVLGLIVGLIVGVVLALISMAGLTPYRPLAGAAIAGLGLIGAIVGGIVSGIISAILAVIYALLYNITASITGGLELELSEARVVYPTATTAYPAPRPVEATPKCPRCGSPLRYIKEYKRWWCDTCRQYV